MPVPMIKSPRSLLMLPVLILISHLLAAQSNISGIVNSYYKVIQVIPAKACVRLNTTIGLGYNDKAMIVQMKGASINTASTTSSSFGDTTSLNDAGNYEIGTICNIRGDSVFFDYMFLNNYTVAGQVQLVRIPEYYSATVVDTLKAAPWDNTAGTGGVLAIFVNQDLVLNKPISADTVGYRGGMFRLSSGTCSNIPGATAYAYNPTSSTQLGAYKGEGVADLVITQAGGRGAPANGGGGGNNHNNAGAGGANLAAGGDGGGNSSSSGCSLSIQGKAGKALSSYGGKKIFMGGGGGAGHANNGFAASNGGGHGGGIVFIRALNIIGNGYKISANGQTGGPALSDGASGGGAGGTIILSAASYTGPMNITANGGQGGTEDDGGNINKCYGSGGGGSGGVIYFSGSVPGGVTATAGAGNAGPEINHDVSCNAAVASSAGLAGQVITSYTFRSSLVLSNSYCTNLLPIELVSFNAYFNTGKVVVSWKTVQPELVDHFVIERSEDAMHWNELNTMSAEAVKTDYSYEDFSPVPGNNFYRIKIFRKSNAVSYSGVRKVIVPLGNEVIAIYPNPASGKIFVSGLNSSSLFTVFDQTGKLIFEKKVVATQHIIEVDLPALPKGVYLIRAGDAVKRLSIY